MPKEYFMTLEPVNDRIVVRPIESSVTTGGIHLPSTVANEKNAKGTVIAVGPGYILQSGEHKKTQVKVGDTVIYEKFNASEIEVDKQKLFVMPENAVLSIIRD